MINIKELATLIIKDGYIEEYAEAKLAQDILLLLISKSIYKDKIAIKGGFLMKNISNDARRTTLDIDIDFIKFSLNDENIINFLNNLNEVEEIKIKITKPLEKLKHQEYNGKRVYVELKDFFGNTINTKIDIGVHKYFNINQETLCFDIQPLNEGVLLLANSLEQVMVEKLKAILKFGEFSTRYKDIYDIYYLLDKVDKNKVIRVTNILITSNNEMKENTLENIVYRIEEIFHTPYYIKKLQTSNKNWMEVDNNIILNEIVIFLKSLINLN